MREGWTYKKLWEVLVFDKRFKGISKEKQKKVASFEHVSAEKLKEIKADKGDVRLISTGLFDGFTTENQAKDYVNSGEIITIPTGGVANIKYYKGKFVDSGNIIGISGNKELQLKYVYYFLLFNKKQVNSYYRGVSIKHPYMPDICEMVIPIPPVKEQQNILLQLDILQTLIEKQKAQLNQLDSLAHSIFYDMFGNPLHNDKGWEIKKLGDCCNSISYGTSAPSSSQGDYIYLRMNNITYNGELDLSDIKYISLKPADIQKYIVKEGDILFNRTNSADLVGKTTWFHNQKPMVIAGYIIRVRLKGLLLPVFVSWFMNIKEMKLILKSMGKGAVNQSNINSKELQNILIPVPPLSLQQSFAAKIESIEKQKAAIIKSLEETHKLFEYTMDKYFS